MSIKHSQIMRISFVLTLVNVLAFQANAQESIVIPPVHAVVVADTLFNELRTELLGKVENGDLPSLAVGVIYEDKILWEEALG